MNTLDLHPEELFDKAAAGTLNDNERVYLDGHLAQCEVCRFERQVRADFDAVSGSDVNVDALVAQALGAAAPEQQGVLSLERRSRRRTMAILAGGALVFSTMASFAAVAQWTGVWPKIMNVFVAPEPAPVVVPPVLPKVPKRPDPVAVAPVPEPVVETPEPISAPVPVVAPKPAPVKHAVAAPAPVVSATPEIPVAPMPSPVADAAVLFDRANRARVQGERDSAIGQYRALLEKFPAAPEANLTRATLGRLLLDTGDATGSLVQLDAYLRSGDLTLREEVLSARAIALNRLGRTADEAAAWKKLLDGYPDSIHAARAQARLEELGRR